MAESNRQRRFFPDAFKLEAVAAIRGGRSVSEVAAELGLPDRLVRAWLRWAEGRTAAGERRAGADAHHSSRRRRRAAWARARPTRRRRSGGCGVSSIASGWSATS